ncbi:hypothetical protein DPMN_175451 [Dreissena polymorpha]|uniref:Uncharacterized protein n=1 Tax=Dreissena polymorpha TaxID=45954 RepID=A0A9D4IH96_DREPO|nr:hypothetical protein DPMN_175451 [Dreissena polymorpha]
MSTRLLHDERTRGTRGGQHGAVHLAHLQLDMAESDSEELPCSLSGDGDASEECRNLVTEVREVCVSELPGSINPVSSARTFLN